MCFGHTRAHRSCGRSRGDPLASTLRIVLDALHCLYRCVEAVGGNPTVEVTTAWSTDAIDLADGGQFVTACLRRRVALLTAAAYAPCLGGVYRSRHQPHSLCTSRHHKSAGRHRADSLHPQTLGSRCKNRCLRHTQSVRRQPGQGHADIGRRWCRGHTPESFHCRLERQVPCNRRCRTYRKPRSGRARTDPEWLPRLAS